MIDCVTPANHQVNMIFESSRFSSSEAVEDQKPRESYWISKIMNIPGAQTGS